MVATASGFVPLLAGSVVGLVGVVVPILVIVLLFSLLFEIRNNTRRTAEALERLADRDDGDDEVDEEGVFGLFDSPARRPPGPHPVLAKRHSETVPPATSGVADDAVRLSSVVRTRS